jgi:uncharacterized protein (TIGR02271 family)
MRNTSHRIAAFFDSPAQAEDALRDLRDAGFRADQIGCTFGGADMRDIESMDQDHRSLWQKIKDFFDADDYREGDAISYAIPERFHSRFRKGTCLVTVFTEDRIEGAEQILSRHGASIERDFALEEARSGDIEGRRIQLLSEVLRINKERVQVGEVKLRKDVVTERQNIEVPVTREELVIERTPVQGQRPASGEFGTDREIKVPLSEERVHVEKKPVVAEEVQVGKKKIHQTRTVAEDVQREELKVEEEGDVRISEDPRKRKTA